MERVWTFVWAIELRAFPIQAISREAGGNVERIPFVGPPAIEAHGEILAMSVPVAACLGLVELRDFAGIAHGAAQLVRENDNVDDGAEIIFVEGLDCFRRIGEDAGIPNEGTVVRVPAGRTESGAEVDHGVTRTAFFAKRCGFAQNFFFACERTMRLLVAETPEGREFGKSRQARVFGH